MSSKKWMRRRMKTRGSLCLLGYRVNSRTLTTKMESRMISSYSLPLRRNKFSSSALTGWKSSRTMIYREYFLGMTVSTRKAGNLSTTLIGKSMNYKRRLYLSIVRTHNRCPLRKTSKCTKKRLRI
jgi:hypothetical protein